MPRCPFASVLDAQAHVCVAGSAPHDASATHGELFTAALSGRLGLPATPHYARGSRAPRCGCGRVPQRRGDRGTGQGGCAEAYTLKRQLESRTPVECRETHHTPVETLQSTLWPLVYDREPPLGTAYKAP